MKLVLLLVVVGVAAAQNGGSGGNTFTPGGSGGTGGSAFPPGFIQNLTPEQIAAFFGPGGADEVPDNKEEEICAERRGQRLICKTCELCMKETADGPACLKDPTCTDDDGGIIKIIKKVPKNTVIKKIIVG